MSFFKLNTFLFGVSGLFLTSQAYSFEFNTPIVNDNNSHLVELPIVDEVPDPRSFGMKYILLSDGVSGQSMYSIRPVTDAYKRDASDTYFAFNTVFDKKPILSILENRSAYVSSEMIEPGTIGVEYVMLNLDRKGYLGRIVTQQQRCNSYNFSNYENLGIIMKNEVPTALGAATLQVGSSKELTLIAMPLNDEYSCQYYPINKLRANKINTKLLSVNEDEARLLVNGKSQSVRLANKLISLPLKDLHLYLK